MLKLAKVYCEEQTKEKVMNDLPKYTIGQQVIVGADTDRQIGIVTTGRIDSGKWVYSIDLGKGHGMPLVPEAAITARLKADGSWVSNLGDTNSAQAYQL